MAFTIRVSSGIKTNLILKRLKNFKLETFAAKEWYKLYYPFIPMRSGRLANDVSIRAGEIVHRAPYARVCYMTNRRYKKALHPLATCRWDIAAIPTRRRKLISAVQNYLKRKGPILR